MGGSPTAISVSTPDVRALGIAFVSRVGVCPTPAQRRGWHGLHPYHAGVTRALVVEDDPLIAQAVVEALAADGHDTRAAGTIAHARSLAREWEPDVVVLDLGLPDGDGVDLCRSLRAQAAQVRIVVLTARDDDIDVIVGLDAGANDYVTKPFALPVLLARVRAQLRPPVSDASQALSIGSLLIDPAAHRATLDGAPLDLRPREFALLHLLARDRGRVVTHERILTELWGASWDRAARKSLETHVHSLRRKLGPTNVRAEWITTIRTIGYRFVSA